MTEHHITLTMTVTTERDMLELEKAVESSIKRGLDNLHVAERKHVTLKTIEICQNKSTTTSS